ncbi:MAG: hypothetical protein J6Z06_02295 [Lachnospiraceae bacterium]|nr:hypothetical protein [Lachnospiraceae bacterium]
MTYEQFLKEVPTHLQGRFPADTQIRIRTVLKNNDRKLDGVVICEPGNTISPTIYLNGFFRRVEEGEASFTDVMDDLVMLYENNRPAKDLDVDFFSDYHRVRPRIIYKVVSKVRNKELLEDVPHLDYLDLAVVFLCLFDQKEKETATILLHNSHLKLWKVTVEDLWKAASVNTPRLMPYVIQPMGDVLSEVMGIPMDDELKTILEFHRLYIVSNVPRVHGATTMLYPNMLSEFAKCMQSDFFIIPSSIHELIFFPSNDRKDYAGLMELIQQVNATEVEPEDILSDHPYYYCRETGEITY